MPMNFYSEVGSQYWLRKIFIQALITPNSNCFLNGETISWSSDMISTYETYVSSGCEVSQNALPNFIFPHIFLCTPWLWQTTSVVWKSIFPVEAVIMPNCNINFSCKCVVFCPWFLGSLCTNMCSLIMGNPNCFSRGGYQNKPYYDISLPC